MANIGELSVRINAKTDQLEKSLGGVQDRLKGVGDRVSGVGKGMSKWVTGPIAGAAGAITGLVMKTAAYGDELDKTSSKLGVNVEQLQDWRHWAEQNGLSADALDRGIGRLNQRIGRAIDGNEKYEDAFKALNVQLKDAEGNTRDTNEVMKDTVEALMEVEDPAMRSAKASEVFGTKMARDLMPALEDGSLTIEEAVKQMDEHGRITEEQAGQSAKFQDALDNVKKSFMGIVHEIGQDFLPMVEERLFPLIEDKIIPAIRDFADRIQVLIEWFQGLSPETQRYIGIAVSLAAVLGPVLIVVGKIIGAIGMLIPVIKGLGVVVVAVTSPLWLKIAAVAALVAAIIYLWKNWDKVSEWLRNIWDATLGKLISWGGDMVSSVKGAAGDVYNAIIDGLKALPGEMLNIGKNIIDGLIKGIRDGIARVGNAVKDVAGTVRDFLPFSPAKEGPLRQEPDFESYIGAGIDERKIKGQMEHALQTPSTASPSGMRGQTANITVMLDGKTIARAVGEPLMKEMRVRTGMKI